MLTFILLVVLAGGVGLVAVSAAERDDPARKLLRSRREGTSWYERISAFSEEPADTDAASRGAPPTDPTPEPATAVQPTSAAEMAPPTPRRANRGNVPERFTAVEGAFGVIAYPSRGHRAFSMIRMVLLVVVLSVVIAGTTGAAIAAIARALDSAIG